MANWQEKIGGTFKAAMERQEAIVSGAQRGISLGGDVLEKFAGFQLGLATDGVDAAVRQVKLLGQPGGVTAYVRQQVEFASDSAQTARARASELGDLLRETVADAAGLFATAAPASGGSSRSRKAS
jgi:hypothetical protein